MKKKNKNYTETEKYVESHGSNFYYIINRPFFPYILFSIHFGDYIRAIRFLFQILFDK